MTWSHVDLSASSQPAFEAIAVDVENRIVEGELKPGDQLPVESRMCEIYGVGRTSVREAVRILTAQGLVHTLRGVRGGTFVSSPDLDRVSEVIRSRLGGLSRADALGLDELLEVRELIEVPAARLAAQRATPDESAELVRLAASIGASDAHSLNDHQEFHERLTAASRNRLLSVLGVAILGVLDATMDRAEVTNEFWEAVDVDHRLLAHRVSTGDATGAAKAAQAHVNRLRELYLPRQPVLDLKTTDI